MKAIVLAGRGISKLPQSSRFQTSLAWIVNSLREAGISDINVVGGKAVERLDDIDGSIKIIYNHKWDKTGPLDSLLLYEDLIIDTDTIISFGDVIYTKDVVKNFIENLKGEDIEIVSDNNWSARYKRDKASISKAEKIWVGNLSNVKRSSRDSDNITNPSSEYTGICYIKRDFGSKIVEISKYLLGKKKLMTESNIPVGFMDLFTEVVKQGYTIRNHNILGNWAELDNPDDFNNFIFGTKARTLAHLKGQLKHGKILTQVSFKVRDWLDSKGQFISKIQNHFRNKNLIVRSSSSAEDSLNSSLAGKFKSVTGVNRDSPESIEKAVQEVIDSYGKSKSSEDFVFVQPVLPNVVISGVAFTCDLRTGAHYNCVNYTKSEETDIITSGSDGDIHLFYHLKYNKLGKNNKHMIKLIKCSNEIEQLVDNPMLDIEFAFDVNDVLFIFQVRPITNKIAIERYMNYKTVPLVKEQIKILEDIFSTKTNLAGNKTVLGKMPDWNPAELIGSRPKPLSVSLFHRLITKKVWRIARGNIGYFNPKSEELLRMVFGQPFIDVRSSLNSFTPHSLPDSLRKMLVEEAIEFLVMNPQLHDKLEFDVATTCYTSYFYKRKERWSKFGFSDKDIEIMKSHFREHTLAILNGKWGNCEDLIREVEKLDLIRKKVLDDGSKDKIYQANQLIIECEKRGTIPFSTLARFAFIGNTFLRSFVSEGIISKESYNLYFNSIDTIATEMLDELNKFRSGKKSIEEFLDKFGHLRPGTFDINSFRYDEEPDLYFDLEIKQGNPSLSNVKYSFSKQEKLKIKDLLNKLELNVEVNFLLKFIEDSIKGREYSKFLFSRSISDALKLINLWGDAKGISREDLSFINFDILVNMDFGIERRVNNTLLKKYIEIQKKEFQNNHQFLLPDLIFNPKDLISFNIQSNKPNFITSISVSGDVIKISNIQKGFDIKDKIVMIESADPGYDWIFTHGIKGLMTKYGGAASHMAIRCAEFNLPAAIGCGNLFDDISTDDRIIIDCSNQLIKKI